MKKQQKLLNNGHLTIDQENLPFEKNTEFIVSFLA